MTRENVSLDFRLKIEEKRSYLLEEIKQNRLIAKSIKMCLGLYFTLSIFLFSFLLLVGVFQFWYLLR